MGFLRVSRTFGQSLNIIVSQLCTLANRDRKLETARKVRILKVGKALGMFLRRPR